MPQHDMIVANGSGAAVRADINDALAALGSTMKGPNAPPAPIAGMMWLDDDTPSASVWTLKIYDGADWISIATFDISANTWAPSISLLRLAAGTAASPSISFGDADTGFYGPAAGEIAATINGADAYRMRASGTRHQFFGADGATIHLISGTTRGIRVSTDTSNAYLDGVDNTGGASYQPLALRASEISLSSGSSPVERMRIPATGPVTVDGRALQIQRGTEQATTSGAQIDFTSIPAGVRWITVAFGGVSFTGADAASIQLGASGGIETTGYVGQIGIAAGTGAGSNLAPTGAAQVIYNGTAAADNCSGLIQIVNQSGNKWLISGNITRNGTVPQICVMEAEKTLSGVLDRIRFKVDGASSFDGGTINLLWGFGA